MPSAYIIKRQTKLDGTRYRVLYRVGGRESTQHYAGSFRTLKEAQTRRAWIVGELAAMRVPDLALLDEPKEARMLSAVFEDWRRSRIDVDEATATTYRTSQHRIIAAVGDVPIDRIDVAWVAGLVSTLHQNKAKRESIRKTRAHLAMALDFSGVTPNPARDKSVRLPRVDEEEMTPPLATHVEATLHALAKKYRLPHLVYDASGMRLRELENLEWRDVDEIGRRWRVRKEIAKTRRPRWVPFDRFPNEDAGLVFDAVCRLVPREDRDPAARVFAGFDGDAYRTELTRACKAAGVPAFTPNDLRHRRASLWHLGGVAPADAASWLGHSTDEHLRTYAHATIEDRSEIDYVPLLFGLAVVSPVLPREAELAN